MEEKIKVVFVSNFSKALTGFGKNMKNILMNFYQDDRFEIVEAANGVSFGADLKTPWKSYGTFPSDPRILQEIKQDPQKERLAQYGNYTIDQIVEKEKPDIVVGIEDIWAFDWAKKRWFDNIHTVIWTTLDSSPILDQAYHLAPKVDRFFVWASFAEKEMKEKGFDVKTIHGAIDYSSFFPFSKEEKQQLKKKHNLEKDFVVGFVFKNQLRKSVPNLLEGFRQFQESLDSKNKGSTKLLLHTDWVSNSNSWDIEKYIQEKGLKKEDILATYICKSCRNYSIKPYFGEEIKCDHCGNEKSFVTKNNGFGVSEEQLNEIYNIMDVYCHPFTSGGQELPIQEAKAAGLITLVTEYSCGKDSCYEYQGGMPLKWVEYREPFTQFIKATTLPESICENLIKVKLMPENEKEKLISNGIKWVKEEFSVDRITNRLKDEFLKLGKIDWDFNFEDKSPNYKYTPDENLNMSDVDWLKDVYKNIFSKNLKDIDIEIKQGEELIKQNGRDQVLNYLRGVAIEKYKQIISKSKSIEDYFLGDENEKRVAVVIPESAGDVLLVNSLIENLKKKHEGYNIYFVTDPKFFPMISSNEFITNLIPYQEGMDNLLLWEGQGTWKGYVDICYLPFVGSQRFLNYLHGEAKDKDQFNLYSENFMSNK